MDYYQVSDFLNLGSLFPFPDQVLLVLSHYSLTDFPWGEISERIVDVGGGEGGLLLPLLKAFPNLSGVIQDRPETVPLAKKNFEANLPEAIKDNRIEFEVHDFFKPQVRKGEGHLFLMRFIIREY